VPAGDLEVLRALVRRRDHGIPQILEPRTVAEWRAALRATATPPPEHAAVGLRRVS